MRTAFTATATPLGPQLFDPAVIAAAAIALLDSADSDSSRSGAWHILAAVALHPGSFNM